MKAYLDTSFLVSLYVLDRNSAGAARAIPEKADLLLTPLGELELTNALQLRLFRSELNHTQVTAASRLFEQDLRDHVYSVRPIPPAAYDKAKQLSRKHSARLGTRSLDLLHVAAALTLAADALCSFDASQRRLAQAEKLPVRPAVPA